MKGAAPQGPQERDIEAADTMYANQAEYVERANAAMAKAYVAYTGMMKDQEVVDAMAAREMKHFIQKQKLFDEADEPTAMANSAYTEMMGRKTSQAWEMENFAEHFAAHIQRLDEANEPTAMAYAMLCQHMDRLEHIESINIIAREPPPPPRKPSTCITVLMVLGMVLIVAVSFFFCWLTSSACTIDFSAGGHVTPELPPQLLVVRPFAEFPILDGGQAAAVYPILEGGQAVAVYLAPELTTERIGSLGASIAALSAVRKDLHVAIFSLVVNYAGVLSLQTAFPLATFFVITIRFEDWGHCGEWLPDSTPFSSAEAKQAAARQARRFAVKYMLPHPSLAQYEYVLREDLVTSVWGGGGRKVRWMWDPLSEVAFRKGAISYWVEGSGENPPASTPSFYDSGSDDPDAFMGAFAIIMRSSIARSPTFASFVEYMDARDAFFKEEGSELQLYLLFASMSIDTQREVTYMTGVIVEPELAMA